MPFKRYMEIGRVAMINFGEEYGQLVAVSDIIDQNRVCGRWLRACLHTGPPGGHAAQGAPADAPGVLLQALVDAPGQARRVVNFKRLTLTDLKVDIPRLASKKVLTAKFAEAGACWGGHEGCHA